MKNLDVSFESLIILIDDINTISSNFHCIEKINRYNKVESNDDDLGDYKLNSITREVIAETCELLDETSKFFKDGVKVYHSNKNLLNTYKISYLTYLNIVHLLHEVGFDKDDCGINFIYDDHDKRIVNLVKNFKTSITMMLDTLSQIIHLMSSILTETQDH